MREIKFRGKRIDGEGWVVGDLILSCGRAWIRNRDDRTTNPRRMGYGYAEWSALEVDPATVGQYTGLKDKNGKDIYEGDILRLWRVISGIYTVVFRDRPLPVVYCDKRSQFVVEDAKIKNERLSIWDEFDFVEVIGNIHDNPELMKEAQG